MSSVISRSIGSAPTLTDFLLFTLGVYLYVFFDGVFRDYC